jgi:four helix bundle protein
MKKIRSFTDLVAWQKAHKLVLAIYKYTENFPKAEEFGLKNQWRRAAVSMTSNIAEGFSRQTYKEKKQFYVTALGSLTEIQNQMLIARDVHYVTEEIFQRLADQSVTVSKILNGLIKATRMRS